MTKKYAKTWREKNKDKTREYGKRYKKKYPWVKHYMKAKERCGNKNNHAYDRYGGKGVKCLIKIKEVKYLWFRDKAWELEQPSIDRRDSEGNYTIENCRFIEKSENTRRGALGHIAPNRVPVEQLTMAGKWVASFDSITQAGKETTGEKARISKCLICPEKYKSSGGYRWIKKIYFGT